jgi:hypothetical protein
MPERNEELVKAAEEALSKAIDTMNRSPYAYQAGAASMVAAAAYALAIARGDSDVPAPAIVTATSEHHRHGLFS